MDKEKWNWSLSVGFYPGILFGARACLRDEIEEAMLNRSKRFNENISNIELNEEEIL